MQPHALNLEELLAIKHQYQVPIFQRQYSWGKRQRVQLWDDIEEQYLRNIDPDKKVLPKTHFMGSIVLAPSKPHDVVRPTSILIDGQQRLLTITLILCALRDHLADAGSIDVAAFDRECLINEGWQGDKRLKVLPPHTIPQPSGRLFSVIPTLTLQ